MPELSQPSAGPTPAEFVLGDSPLTRAQPGIGLCLSGGGYRAMLFHLGTLWRLNGLGYLPRLSRVSSVSGGSITAAMLGMNWAHLNFGGDGIARDFTGKVVEPVRQLAGRTIDIKAGLTGLFAFGSISEKVEKAYRKHLYGDATLQDLPDEPRFIINATNVQSGALWRFSKPYMRDYRVGEIKKPSTSLAKAVAASSAFPPVLSPARLKLNPGDFTPGSGEDLQKPPYTETVVLSDGGVYDNLGLESVFKRYQTVLVSDAGGKLSPEAAPKQDWARHSIRVLDIVDNQVRSLRKRALLDTYANGTRKGAFWGIRTDIADYGLGDSLTCPHAKTLRLAQTPTRLAKLDEVLQKRLINWGYAVCDAAMRKYVDPGPAPPNDFPYPSEGVG